MTRVLIVDDSSAVRERLAEKLSAIRNVRVAGLAHTTKDALDKFRQLSPSVVILDIELPDGNGFDVLEKIKQEGPDTLVIMLTNYALPQHRKRSLQGGADFFLDKSSGFNTVYDLLHWLSERQSVGGINPSRDPENVEKGH